METYRKSQLKQAAPERDEEVRAEHDRYKIF